MTREINKSTEKDSLESVLRASQRVETVSDGLHKNVMARVHNEQLQQSNQAAPQARRAAFRAIPALVFCAAALLLGAYLLNEQGPKPRQTPSISDFQNRADNDVQSFVNLLDTRLAQPLTALQSLKVANPLVQELAALESDLDRLKPRWPWEDPSTEG